MTQSPKNTYFKDLLQGIGTIVGVPYAINAAINLTQENIASISYAGKNLANCLPLSLYQVVIPVLLIGTFANYYSNLGTAIDIIIDGIKTSPSPYSINTVKKCLEKCNAKNVGHVTGAMFGCALAGTFIYYNVALSDKAFSLPYGAAQSVPNELLQTGAVFYISGMGSNLFSHFTEGTKNVIKGTNSCMKSFYEGTSSLFGKYRKLHQQNVDAVAVVVTEEKTVAHTTVVFKK